MNPYAMRYEPNWSYFNGHEEKAKEVKSTLATMKMMYSTSYGLCQIMGAVYYDMGGKNFATELIDPEVNIAYASKILKKINTKHPDFLETYAVYNAGKLSFNKSGDLINQANVDRFKEILNKTL